jgi:HEAT repeat protein
MISYGSIQQKIDAIEKLRKVKSKRALRPLILALKGVSVDSAATKQYVYPSKLSDVDNPPTVNVDLSEHNSPQIKFLAAQALGEIGHESALKPLTEVYKALLEKVGEKERPAFNENIEPTLSKDYPQDYPLTLSVNEIARAIGTLISNFNREDLDPEYQTDYDQAIETLKTSLTSHKNIYMRAGAADGLKNAFRPAAADILKAAVGNEKSDYVKAAIYGGIIYTTKTEIDPFNKLIKLLANNDPYVRIKAASGIGESGIATADTHLKKALLFEDSLIVKAYLKNSISQMEESVIPKGASSMYKQDK